VLMFLLFFWMVGWDSFRGSCLSFLSREALSSYQYGKDRPPPLVSAFFFFFFPLGIAPSASLPPPLFFSPKRECLFPPPATNHFRYPFCGGDQGPTPACCGPLCAPFFRLLLRSPPPFPEASAEEIPPLPYRVPTAVTLPPSLPPPPYTCCGRVNWLPGFSSASIPTELRIRFPPPWWFPSFFLSTKLGIAGYPLLLPPFSSALGIIPGAPLSFSGKAFSPSPFFF